jgi:hypothetical protein
MIELQSFVNLTNTVQVGHLNETTPHLSSFLQNR